MSNDAKDDDIREVIAAESRRGKRPLDIKERERLAREREILLRILHIENEQEFLRAIRELGYAEDAEKTEAILRAWRALSSSRKR